jgi:hypothetical protein
MPFTLDLPQELRHKIFGLVRGTPAAPPSNPLDNVNREVFDNVEYIDECDTGIQVRYMPQGKRTEALPTLLVNY